ncbi:transposable element tc1, partial [Stemphylium lycopersici]
MDEPSTPKHRKQLTRDQRLMVHTLYNAGNTQKWIANHLGFTIRQVQYVLKRPLTPKKRPGRPGVLTPEQVQELIDFVRSSQETRQMTYFELAHHFEDWHIGEYVVRSTLRSRGYRRCMALQKPPLTPQNRAKRMAFAEAHINWTVEQWNTILWSDESWDNAKAHSSKGTSRELALREVRVLSWPPFSPDLNPIEGVWAKMKDYIEIHYPDLPYGQQRTYSQLRRIVKEAWDEITPEYLSYI